jgi:prevent-host-death family protein
MLCSLHNVGPLLFLVESKTYNAAIFGCQSKSCYTLCAKFSADLATGPGSTKLTRDIQSLSTFKRDTAKIVRQLKKTGQPVVLTVNGKAELVVQDAASYQKLLEAQDKMEAIKGIRRGLESLKRNGSKSVEKFFREFFAEKGFSERE